MGFGWGEVSNIYTRGRGISPPGVGVAHHAATHGLPVLAAPPQLHVGALGMSLLSMIRNDLGGRCAATVPYRTEEDG